MGGKVQAEDHTLWRAAASSTTEWSSDTTDDIDVNVVSKEFDQSENLSTAPENKD